MSCTDCACMAAHTACTAAVRGAACTDATRAAACTVAARAAARMAHTVAARGAPCTVAARAAASTVTLLSLSPQHGTLGHHHPAAPSYAPVVNQMYYEQSEVMLGTIHH